MQESLKGIGQRLQKLVAGMVRRPLGWSEIDKLAEMDEREEALKSRDDKDKPPPRR